MHKVKNGQEDGNNVFDIINFKLCLMIIHWAKWWNPSTLLLPFFHFCHIQALYCYLCPQSLQYKKWQLLLSMNVNMRKKAVCCIACYTGKLYTPLAYYLYSIIIISSQFSFLLQYLPRAWIFLRNLNSNAKNFL
jgi:hypothetical protein